MTHPALDDFLWLIIDGVPCGNGPDKSLMFNAEEAHFLFYSRWRAREIEGFSCKRQVTVEGVRENVNEWVEDQRPY